MAKCYLREPGSDVVREHAVAARSIACCEIGKVELAAVLHRHFREGRLTRSQYGVVVRQFEADLDHGLWIWLPSGAALQAAALRRYKDLPAKFFLRAADALHLACAEANGFSEIFTNDRHMLAASAAFGLQGRNLLSD